MAEAEKPATEAEMICVENTPVTEHPEFRLYVKHEELCNPGGPHFSKMRGVEAHIAKRSEKVIGVLDTAHSQGGWAVARACKELGKRCVLYYPVRKSEQGDGPKSQQREAARLGARLVPLPAARSAILYHQARKRLAAEASDSIMMPNALKLPETVSETAHEFERTSLPSDVDCVLVSASSGTIAAGVLRALARRNRALRLIIHLGYSRSEAAVRRYLGEMATESDHITSITRILVDHLQIVDEGYAYKDRARDGPTPPFASNEFYDLKAFRWWVRNPQGKALFWNIG